MRTDAQQKLNMARREGRVTVSEALWRLRVSATPFELVEMLDVDAAGLVRLADSINDAPVCRTGVEVLGPVTVSR